MNKFATLILFDVGCQKFSDDCFFARSKHCLCRLIVRKIFSRDRDLLAIILFGLDGGRKKHSNIRQLYEFREANFSMLNKVENIKPCKGSKSDWVSGAIESMEFLERSFKNMNSKRFKSRQIIIISEFRDILHYEDTIIDKISCFLRKFSINLIVVGPEMDLESDKILQNFKLLVPLFELVKDTLYLNINDFTDSVKYFEKKRKLKLTYRNELEIGNRIRIPVGCVKLTNETQRFYNWFDISCLVNEGNSNNLSESETNKYRFKVQPTKSNYEPSLFSKPRDKSIIKFIKFGATEINLGEAELTALKRLSGPSSFKILIFTCRSQVDRSMYVGTDIYAVSPQKNSANAQVQFHALIDAMIKGNKVAIARRISLRNGKIKLGVLIPLRSECALHMFFLSIPTAEWIEPFPRYTVCPPVAQSVKDKFKTLIDAMRIPPNLMEGSDRVLVTNPYFQLRCQLFANRASDPTCDISVMPQYIQEIIDPRPECRYNIGDVTKDILNSFPSLNWQVRKVNTWSRELTEAVKSAERRLSYDLTCNTDIKTEVLDSWDHTNIGLNSINIVDETSIAIKKEMEYCINDADSTYQHSFVQQETVANKYVIGTTSASLTVSTEYETGLVIKEEVEDEHEDIMEFNNLLQQLD